MKPLAERLRPTSLRDYVGQKHLVGESSVLGQAIREDRVHSMILWGPPGVGKTTLARLIAQETKRGFYSLSAIDSGVKQVREVIQSASSSKFFDQASPILFIDEIHRFSKSQQDALLSAVETGTVTLIGATTENPSFEVISALLSRSQVYILKPLDEDDLLHLLTTALEKDLFVKNSGLQFSENEALLKLSQGDARKLYNIIEIAAQSVNSKEDKVLGNQEVQALVQQNIQKYDKAGEAHYDTASAFIKSMRGSDPNAAVYYLARMVEGGEDVKFIARRMIILAAEDIGLANPNALLIANACFDAVHKIGMPEARIILSQAAIYLANSPKSNSAYMAIKDAQSEVQKSGSLSIPLSVRNPVTSLMKDIGYGKNYEYAHQHDGNFINMEFLPEEIMGKVFYNPGENPAEERWRQRLSQLWKEKYGY